MTTFRHSGKLGDIIYSLPAVMARGGGLYYLDHRTAYLGKPALGETAALQMAELLQTQPYIPHAELYAGQKIDFDFDKFRNKALPLHVYNEVRSNGDRLASLFLNASALQMRDRLVPRIEIDLPQYHWDSAGLSGTVELSRPWLSGLPPKPLAPIVIARSSRYPGNLNWKVLQPYAAQCVFLGLEPEWHSFRKEFFDVAFYCGSTLLDVASVIAGAKLFAGNQSFALSLADAMAKPRFVELARTNSLVLRGHNAHTLFAPGLIDQHLAA